MNAAAFDTHAAVKALRKAGADEAMAEAIVNTASAAAGASHADLATKADLRIATDPLATKAELRTATEPLATKAELRTATEPLATKAELQPLATKADLQPFATKADLQPFATKAELASVRAELGTIRWTIGLLAAFMFAIGLRVFGIL